MKELTKRQKEVLSFIAKYKTTHPYSPTIREVAEHFCMSVKGAHDHILAIKRKGHLKIVDRKSRTMELVSMANGDTPETVNIQILGTIAAGVPILSEENFDGIVKINRSMLKKNKK
jgi:repressor LexA